MDASVDVQQMQRWSNEVADLTARSTNMKDRISAVAKAFGVEWGRAKSFYYGNVRRGEGFEKDAARAAVTALRAQHAETDLQNSLMSSADHLERLDPELYGETIAELRNAIVSEG